LWSHPGAGATGSWTLTSAIGVYTGYPSQGQGPETASPIAGFYSENDNTDHVFFVGSNAHIWELYVGDGSAANQASWNWHDLNVAAGATLSHPLI
jgi:hypothetical protein